MRICPDCKSEQVTERLVGWFSCNADEAARAGAWGDLEVDSRSGCEGVLVRGALESALGLINTMEVRDLFNRMGDAASVHRVIGSLKKALKLAESIPPYYCLDCDKDFESLDEVEDEPSILDAFSKVIEENFQSLEAAGRLEDES